MAVPLHTFMEELVLSFSRVDKLDIMRMFSLLNVSKTFIYFTVLALPASSINSYLYQWVLASSLAKIL